jgi:outer membrane protein assembly factor BamB
VYVGTVGGVLYALDADRGSERWHYKLRGPIESKPVVAGDMIFFTSGENRIYAVDAHTGKWKWQYDRESPESFTIRGTPGPLFHAGRLYVGFSDGYLACLAGGTGEVVWARSLANDASTFMDVDSTPVLDEGTLYVSSYAGGVYALDPKDGSTRWRYAVEGAGTIVPGDEYVYFSAAKQGLFALDKEGRLAWRQALSKGGELSHPIVAAGYVMVSSSARKGGTYVADARTGRLYQFLFPGQGVTSAPSSDGRHVYVLTNLGYFYALQILRPATQVN